MKIRQLKPAEAAQLGVADDVEQRHFLISMPVGGHDGRRHDLQMAMTRCRWTYDLLKTGRTFNDASGQKLLTQLNEAIDILDREIAAWEAVYR